MGKSPFCALGIESPKSLTDARCCLLSICIDCAVKCTGAQLQTHTHRHPQGFYLAVKHVTVRMFTARMLHDFASVTSPGIFVHLTHMHRPFGSRCQDLHMVGPSCVSMPGRAHAIVKRAGSTEPKSNYRFELP